MWLIVVDVFSKFPYVVPLSNTTSGNTIMALQQIFALEGLPLVIVSDNGTQYTSSEFEVFCRKNGIKHLTTAPFHPASNGEAERFVRTFKSSMNKIISDLTRNKETVEQALTIFLATFRTTPGADGKTPAFKLHNREHRTLLSLLRPNKTDLRYQDATHKFRLDQQVYTRNFSRGEKWVSGKIKKHLGNRMFLVQTQCGLWRRHQNQIIPRGTGRGSTSNVNTSRSFDESFSRSQEIQLALKPRNFDMTQNNNQNGSYYSARHTSDSPRPQGSTSSTTSQQDDLPIVRRSERPRTKTVRFAF